VFLTLISIGIIWHFNRIFLMNLATILLSGCIWFPQIVRNATYGTRNTPKFKHAILTQMTISWPTVYIRVNATGIFNLKPEDYFVVIYLLIIAFQFWLMFVQKFYSPTLIIPDCLKNCFVRVQYTYSRTFGASAIGVDCSICMQNLELVTQEQYYMTPCNH